MCPAPFGWIPPPPPAADGTAAANHPLLPNTLPPALGGNLGGVTSGLLGLDGGEAAGKLRLDVLIPVKGFKRCVDAQNGWAAARVPGPGA